jgi:hypothetical protein
LRVNYKIADERILDILNAVGSVARKEAQKRVKIFEEV